MTILQDDINTVVNRVIQHENQKLPDEIKIKLISLHYTDDKYVTYVLRDNKHIDTKNEKVLQTTPYLFLFQLFNFSTHVILA